MTYMKRDDRWLTVVVFLLCIPSGTSLLAKVYGLAEMHRTVPLIVVPSCAILIIIGFIAPRIQLKGLSETLLIGLATGALDTLSYFLYRVPFLWLGFRVFVPIRVYGIWALDANASSLQTDLVGWFYHVSNGLTFSLAYCCFVRLFALKRRWVIATLAILYSLGLETIAVVTPFAKIFNLSGNVPALLIAYTGHIAYGLPLAWMTSHWRASVARLSRAPAYVYYLALAISALMVAAYLAFYLTAGVPSQWAQRHLVINSSGIQPDITRLNGNESFWIRNGRDEAIEASFQGRSLPFTIDAGDSCSAMLEAAGISQLRIKSSPPVRSGFIIVEPVDAVR
ncbi:MAG TPA: hypothetical protein VNO70_04735 [Blastocatellia bacterium]|nr:hypothetical protein [Blastocatellia bacterium]